MTKVVRRTQSEDAVVSMAIDEVTEWRERKNGKFLINFGRQNPESSHVSLPLAGTGSFCGTPSSFSANS